MDREAIRRDRGGLLRALLRLDDRAAAIVAADGTVLVASPAFESLLEGTAGRRHLAALVGAKTWARISGARKGGGPLALEIAAGSPVRRFQLHWQRSDDGFAVVLRESAGGSPPGLEALAETERRIAAIEGQERIWRLAAHEIANQLVAIRFSTESLLVAAAGSPALEDLRAVLESAETASELLQRVHRATEPSVSAAPIDVGEVVAEFTPLLGRLLSRPVRCVLPEPHRPLPVRTSRSRLEQILSNLAFEAQEVGSREPLTLEVGAARLTEATPARLFGAPPGAYARIALRCEGQDRSSTMRARLQADSPREPTAMALGALQLRALVATQLGGDVAVDHAPRRGTRITVFLPLASPTSSG